MDTSAPTPLRRLAQAMALVTALLLSLLLCLLSQRAN